MPVKLRLSAAGRRFQQARIFLAFVRVPSAFLSAQPSSQRFAPLSKWYDRRTPQRLRMHAMGPSPAQLVLCLIMLKDRIRWPFCRTIQHQHRVSVSQLQYRRPLTLTNQCCLWACCNMLSLYDTRNSCSWGSELVSTPWYVPLWSFQYRLCNLVT